IWIMATNPMVSLPNSEKIKSALQKCPFVVVSDCIKETETAQLADVLLPAQGWSEKSGTVTNSERRISRQRRLLPSPGMAKP
ncbi:molybdopterin-dependent oxidoreductase, partial [Vibrio alfacsensis]